MERIRQALSFARVRSCSRSRGPGDQAPIGSDPCVRLLKQARGMLLALHLSLLETLLCPTRNLRAQYCLWSGMKPTSQARSPCLCLSREFERNFPFSDHSLQEMTRHYATVAGAARTYLLLYIALLAHRKLEFKPPHLAFDLIVSGTAGRLSLFSHSFGNLGCHIGPRFTTLSFGTTSIFPWSNITSACLD